MNNPIFKISKLDDRLFLDKIRLNNYIQSISPGVHFQNSTNFNTEIGFPSGIKLGTGQVKHPRELNDIEKINKLLEYIEKENKRNQILYLERPKSNEDIINNELPIFVYERVNASKFEIPFKTSKDKKLINLIIWISKGETGSDMLCLIENNEYDDKQKSYYSESGFTILLGLLVSFGEKFKKTILVNNLPRGEINFKWQINNPYTKKFFENPFETLEELGCKFCMERKIKSLYKIRSFGPDESSNRKAISTVGYPIFIFEDGVI